MKLYIIFIGSLFALCQAVPLHAQTTAFTYQGRLTDSSIAANGNYNMEFRLYAAPTGGSAIATQMIPTVAVTNGIFTAQLDFGACPTCFDGSDRYIEVWVGMIILSPRQKLNSAPYAVRSQKAGTADNASNLGGIEASQYVQTTDPRLSGASITFNVVASPFLTWAVGNPSDYQSGNNNNPTLVLMRGMTYKFNVSGGHPFRISATQGGPQYTTGVTNNDTTDGVVTFKVPMDAPNTIAYYCTIHPTFMFGTLQIVSGSGAFSGASGNTTEVETLKQQIKDQQTMIDKLRRSACEQNPKAEPCVADMPKTPHMH